MAVKKNRQSFFITFEGPDGSGKDTAIQNLARYLKKSGHQVLLTKEPGGSKIGRQIRKILIDPKNTEMDKLTELLFYIANRNQNIEEQIRPALKEGKIVISSRHADSSVAYQGAARKIDLTLVNKLNKIVCKEVKPDLTIILDVDSKVGLNRAKNRDDGEIRKGQRDRFEKENLDFHQRVRKEYLRMAKTAKRFILLNTTNLNIEKMNKKVIEIVKNRLKI